MMTKFGALAAAAALVAGTSPIAMAQAYYPGWSPRAEGPYACPNAGYMGCWGSDPNYTGFGSDNGGHMPIPQMTYGMNDEDGTYGYGTAYSPTYHYGYGSTYSPAYNYGYRSWGWGR